jgi:class 3 adenylate cyclase
MLGIAPLDLGFTGAYIAVSGYWEAAPLAIVLNLAMLVGVNGLGSTLILRPIIDLDAADAAKRRRARRRLASLSLLMPIWAFTLGAVYCAGVFLAGAYTGGLGEQTQISPGLALSAYGWFAFVYGFYFAFYSYFAVADVAGDYRQRIGIERAVMLRQPFGLKLGLVAVALAVMPPALILQDLTWLAPIRAAQDLTPTDAVLLDLMATMLAAALSLFFVGRSLLRPVNSLVAGFDAVGAQDLSVRLTPASDDELGALAERFNRMVRGLAERRRVEAMFGKYVAPAVARSILADSTDGHIRGAAREATNLFTDIEGFTALSEDLPPDEAIDMLNAYFEAISAPITARGGAIVNLTGDGLHAVFNVPHALDNHARAAVLAARDIQALVASKRFGREPGAGYRLKTRIGIHTGTVVAGSVGCDDRLHYTVYGDAVNVAARLEALNKELGTQTLISAAVVESMGEAGEIEGASLTALSPVSLRGRRQKLSLYRLDPKAA